MLFVTSANQRNIIYNHMMAVLHLKYDKPQQCFCFSKNDLWT